MEPTPSILPVGDRIVPLTQPINDRLFETIAGTGATVDVAGSVVIRMQKWARDVGINSELPILFS